MKVIIAGRRNYYPSNLELAGAIARSGFNVTEIVTGGAKGVDTAADRFAEKTGYDRVVFHANWQKNGLAAGPMRNEKMAAYADALIAFWDGESKGTGNMIRVAKAYKLPVYVVSILPNRMPVEIQTGNKK